MIRSFLHKPFQNKINALRRLFRLILGVVYYRHIFGRFGRGSVLCSPLFLSNTQHIWIGNGVSIREGARLETVIANPAHPPKLIIGNNVTIEQNVHIVSAGNLIIHDNVSIAPNCTILCVCHPFMDVHNPMRIGDRIGGTDATIEIGEGSLIGVGSVIQMNVRIGRSAVVGSNSVVKINVPDFAVVDGNPAAVMMVFDQSENRWKPYKTFGSIPRSE